MNRRPLRSTNEEIPPPSPRGRAGKQLKSRRYSRAAASRIVGLAPTALARWERAAAREIGLRLPASLAFPDVLALGVLREVSARLGARVDGFTAGLGQLFATLDAIRDIERLDGLVALVGQDFARLTQVQRDHVSCVGDAFVVVPLRPILVGLRDLVFP